MKKQIVLSLSHFIYLTREERYSLHDGIPVNVIGITLPVWFHRGDTSEPASEVFTEYLIENDPDKDSIIYTTFKGFQFNLPQIPKDFERVEVSNDEWRRMSDLDKKDLADMNEEPLNSKLLLDLKDGGSEYLHWEQHTKKNKGKRVLAIKNYLEIKDVSKLEESFCF